MKKLVTLSLLVMLAACGAEKESDETTKANDKEGVEDAQSNSLDADQLLNEIEILTQTPKLSKEVVDKILSNSVLFVQKFPEDERAPGVLFMAAANAHMIGERGRDLDKNKNSYFEKCVSLCDQVIDHYPDFDDIKSVYLLKVSVLDLDLRKKDEAVTTYEYLIATYPEDTFNVENNWKMRIENIDVNPLDQILGQ